MTTMYYIPSEERNRGLNIAFNPASYVHKSHLPSTLCEGYMHFDKFINVWLFSQFPCFNVCPELRSGEGDVVLNLIVDHWYDLLNAAPLLGAYLLRNKLLSSPALLMTNGELLSFISLPLSLEVRINETRECEDILALGLAIILQIGRHLPPPLIERLSLIFPKGRSVPDVSAESTAANINVFRMALRYAHNKL